MFFLLRVAFWLSIVVVLLPAGTQPGPDAPAVSTFEAIGAAQAALKDARGFCSREPEACAIGSQALHVFGQKAQNGAKMLYELLSSNSAEPISKQDGPTGSTPKPGRDTLNVQDREMPWLMPQETASPQGPPRREG